MTDNSRCTRLAQRCRNRLRSSVPYFYPVSDRERTRAEPKALGLKVEVACLTAGDGPFSTVKEIGEALHEQLGW